VEVVIAEIAFIVGAVIAAVQKGWALCAVAAGLALVYLKAALDVA
jgi:hypothetical protein